MVTRLNRAFGYLCDGCGDVVDGTAPGYTRFCGRCLTGGDRERSPLPRRFGGLARPRPDDPELEDADADGLELEAG